MSKAPLLVFAHGNPGTHQDFDKIRATLSTPSMAMAPDREALREVLMNQGPGDEWILVAYSWAAYWALREIPAWSRHPARLILMAPYLGDPQPMSTAAQVLLSMDPIRNIIVNRSFAKWRAEFLPRLFSGPEPADFANEKLAGELQHAPIWQSVALRKLEQSRRPLPQHNVQARCPVDVLLAGNDVISPSAVLRETLNTLVPTATLHEFAGASHGFLWTDAERIGECLKGIIPRS